MHDFELCEGQAGVADAIARNLQEIFKKRDAPVCQRGDPPGFVVEVLEVGVPGEYHENIR